MTLKEFARKGGHARAAKLTKERLREIAKLAGQASAKQRASKQQEPCQSAETPENK